MRFLAVGCVLVGIFPALLVRLLDNAIAAWAPGPLSIPLAGIINLWWITAAALPLMICGAAIVLWVQHWRRGYQGKAIGTWGCGYARPSSRMQYTGSSLMQWMGVILRGMLWRRERLPVVGGIFPQAADYTCQAPDPLLDGVAEPVLGKVGQVLESARILQSGSTQLYMLYILLIVLILLLLA